MISMTQKSVEQVSGVFEVVAPIDDQVIASSPVLRPATQLTQMPQLLTQMLIHSEALRPATHTDRDREKYEGPKPTTQTEIERMGKDEIVESLRGLIYITRLLPL
jgi:hypothetical protein